MDMRGRHCAACLAVLVMMPIAVATAIILPSEPINTSPSSALRSPHVDPPRLDPLSLSRHARAGGVDRILRNDRRAARRSMRNGGRPPPARRPRL